MIGVRCGRLVGVGYYGRLGTHAHWHFLCDCGAIIVASGSNVRCGQTSSCGCLHREISAARLLKHGHRAKKRHGSTYRAWQEINTFCALRTSPRFRNFGAIGICVCEAWKCDFEAFLSDMGERPHNTKLARIDPNGAFEAGNCRWEPVPSRATRAVAGHCRRKPDDGPTVAQRGRMPTRAAFASDSGPGPSGIPCEDSRGVGRS